MQPTTPTGSRYTVDWGRVSTKGRPAAKSIYDWVRTYWYRTWLAAAKDTGAPNSLTMQSVSCGSISLKYVSIFFMYSIRSDRGVAAQAGRAAAAAFAALSTSASFPAGTPANLSLFAGFSTSI